MIKYCDIIQTRTTMLHNNIQNVQMHVRGGKRYGR